MELFFSWFCGGNGTSFVREIWFRCVFADVFVEHVFQGLFSPVGFKENYLYWTYGFTIFPVDVKRESISLLDFLSRGRKSKWRFAFPFYPGNEGGEGIVDIVLNLIRNKLLQ